jgi:hypothetical protein
MPHCNDEEESHAGLPPPSSATLSLSPFSLSSPGASLSSPATSAHTVPYTLRSSPSSLHGDGLEADAARSYRPPLDLSFSRSLSSDSLLNESAAYFPGLIVPTALTVPLSPSPLLARGSHPATPTILTPMSAPSPRGAEMVAAAAAAVSVYETAWCSEDPAGTRELTCLSHEKDAVCSNVSVLLGLAVCAAPPTPVQGEWLRRNLNYGAFIEAAWLHSGAACSISLDILHTWYCCSCMRWCTQSERYHAPLNVPDHQHGAWAVVNILGPYDAQLTVNFVHPTAPKRPCSTDITSAEYDELSDDTDNPNGAESGLLDPSVVGKEEKQEELDGMVKKEEKEEDTMEEEDDEEEEEEKEEEEARDRQLQQTGLEPELICYLSDPAPMTEEISVTLRSIDMRMLHLAAGITVAEAQLVKKQIEVLLAQPTENQVIFWNNLGATALLHFEPSHHRRFSFFRLQQFLGLVLGVLTVPMSNVGVSVTHTNCSSNGRLPTVADVLHMEHQPSPPGPLTDAMLTLKSPRGFHMMFAVRAAWTIAATRRGFVQRTFNSLLRCPLKRCARTRMLSTALQLLSMTCKSGGDCHHTEHSRCGGGLQISPHLIVFVARLLVAALSAQAS